MEWLEWVAGADCDELRVGTVIFADWCLGQSDVVDDLVEAGVDH